MTKVDVLVVIDNMYRELAGAFLLQKYLREMGLSSALCGRYSYDITAFAVRPKLVLLPHAAFQGISTLRKICFTCVCPSESGNGQMRQILEINGGNQLYKTFHEDIELFLSWGQYMSTVLQDHKIFPNAKFVTTGSFNNDHWYLPNKSSEGVKKAGLTTSLRTLHKRIHPPTVITNMERTGQGYASYFVPPEHAESWIYWEASLIRLIGNISDQLCVEKGLEIEVKPHPFENSLTYSPLVRSSDGKFSVAPMSTMTEWLDNICVLMTYMSGSAVDAVVRGVPVVSLKGICNQDALAKIPSSMIYDWFDLFWPVTSIDELYELTQESKNGRLAISPRPVDLKNLIWDLYTFPQVQPAAWMQAQEIADFLGNNQKNGDWGSFARALPGPRRAVAETLGRIPGALNLLTLGYQIDWMLLGKENTHYPGIQNQYRFWKYGEIRKASRVAQGVYDVTALGTPR